MRLLAKIGIGILIFTVFLLAIPALKTPTTPTPKVEVPNSDSTLPPSPYDITGTANKEITLGNITIEVYLPTYTKTLYEQILTRYFDDYYRVYTAREGYRFALVKVEAANTGKIEDEPTFIDQQLVTSNGFTYKHRSHVNTTESPISPPPTPVVDDFLARPPILPRETQTGYFWFETPTTTSPDYLTFTYWEMSNPAEDKTVRINL